MRVPKSPEPTALRQVEPEIQKGEFETRVEPEAFGGISQRNISEEGDTTSLGLKVQEQADNYLVNKGMALWHDKISSIKPDMVNAKGENAHQWTPSIEDGAYSKAIDPIKEQVLSVAKDNPRVSSILSTRLMNEEAHLKTDVYTNVAKQTMLTNVSNYDSQIDDIQRAIPTYKNMKNIMYYRGQLDNLIDGRLSVLGKSATAEDQKDKFHQMYDSQVIKNFTATGDIKGATTYAKMIQDSGGALTPLVQKNIFEASTRQNAEKWYSGASVRFKTDDGKPDIHKILSSIPANLTQSEKDIWTKTIMPKYRIDNTQVNSDHSNSMNQFKDVLSKNPDNATIQDAAKRFSWNGASYETMLKLAAQPAHGDLILNFQGKGKQLSTIHRNIYQNLMEGRIDQSALFKLFNDGVLDKDSYYTGQKILDANNKSGINATNANFSRSVHREAIDAYGGDADKAAEFSNEYFKYFADKPGASVIERRKWVDENLKPAMKNPSEFWGNLRREEESGIPGEAEQSLRATIGTDTLHGIYDYLAGSKPENGFENLTDDLQKYVGQLGVTMDDMAVGMPVNNAITSLLEWNRANPTKHIDPSPEKVLQILNAKNADGTEKYPQGMAY